MQRVEDYQLLGVRQQQHRAPETGPSVYEARRLVERSRAARATEAALRVKLNGFRVRSQPPPVVHRKTRGGKADVALGRAPMEYRAC